ncbi:nitrilase-related carbon-nitrogen hydrolase [Anaerolineales bacterium HSG6]|nr:nitrilase-related carbon-nitrogen hydrolase [Anaerolineales bacterium HSG6]
MTTISIGFIQFAPKLNNLASTIQTLEQLFQDYVDPTIDLLVLPELCNSGYNFPSPEVAWVSSETVTKSLFIDYLVGQAEKYNLHIVSGFNERSGDKLYNSAVLVGPTGYIGRYRKLHLFLNEKDFFEPGNLGLPIFDIGQAKIGMLVCFDWVFPEAWRVLALKGVDIICHPSNLVLPGLCQSTVPSHALMNHVYVITANRIGTEENLTFTGLSTIAGPTGQVLYQATQTNVEVGLVDVDLSEARDKAITARNDLFADRRVDVYGDLVS